MIGFSIESSGSKEEFEGCVTLRTLNKISQ